MARPKAKAPTRRYHMSGQSVVTIQGRNGSEREIDEPLPLSSFQNPINRFDLHADEIVSSPDALILADVTISTAVN